MVVKMLINLVMLIIAYLLGSLCAAIFVCKLLKLPDPRSQGSRNPGATNVLRLGGKKAAAIVLTGDMLKGLLAVLIARLLSIDGFALGLIALAAVIGHLFPIYFHFKGGKGVATALGSILGLSPILALIAIITWLIVAKLFHYSSLAALSAMFITTISSFFIAQGDYFPAITAITILLIFSHRENISKLYKGAESKLKNRYISQFLNICSIF